MFRTKNARSRTATKQFNSLAKAHIRGAINRPHETAIHVPAARAHSIRIQSAAATGALVDERQPPARER